MLRNKLVRSDGSIIDSSVIISCEFTEEVNSSTNLSVGDTTTSELTVEILASDSIQQDEVLTYYIIEDGVEKKIGVFNAEKPTVATRTSMRFSAYDNIVKTEKVISGWLRENQDLFPMTLLSLVEHACSYCGVTLATTDFPQAEMIVNAFYADDLTCRQILSWAAAVAGRFIRATVDGEMEFAWYEDATYITVQPNKAGNPVTITDDGEGNISIVSNYIVATDDGAGNVAIESERLQVMDDGEGNATLAVVQAAADVSISYFRDSLSYENYTTDLIERVQINHSEDDVGVIYPPEGDGNCFTISENMILGTIDTANVSLVATSLHDQLKDVTYVPFSVTVPRTIQVRAGDIINILDPKGYAFVSYVMKVSVSASGTTLSATGDKSYGSNAAVSSEKYSNLTGKILTISKSIDGLVIKNEDLDGKIGSLELSTESFRTYVQDSFVTEEDFGAYRTAVSTEFKQTSEDFTMKFETVESSISDVNADLDEVAKGVDNLGQSLDKVSAHIKTGVLYYNEEGSPVYGLEVGQRTEVEGVETFNKYAQFTSDKLSFFDQGGNEVAYIGDQKMFITDAEIKGSQKVGGFIDTVLDDGSIITKWVGGDN